VEIKNVAEMQYKDGFIGFIPKPLANESWAIGGEIVFIDAKNGEKAYTGAIAEYNPDDGMIFIDVTDWKVPEDFTGFNVHYRPFDFSAMLVGAFEKLTNHPELLSTALDRACGIFAEEEGAKLNFGQASSQDSGASRDAGIDRLWGLPWGILWGPPGTGKTEAVARAAARFACDDNLDKILIVTPTNIAADEVTYRICSILSKQKALLKNGYCRIYRGGRGAGRRLSDKFPEALRDRSYAEQYDSTKRKIAGLEEEHETAKHKNDFREAARLRKQIIGLSSSLPDETKFAIKEGKARIIVLTTFKASAFVGDADSPVLFSKVIVDEAGMVSRATCAAMTTMGRTTLLAGDPKQIGPIFASPPGLSKDVRKWLLASGLSHLSSAKASIADSRVHFLQEQFRMHPEISAAVSAFTYDGILRDSEEAKRLEKELAVSPKLPKRRASFLVIDDIAAKTEDAYARKASTGVGYERSLSARVAMGLASAAASGSGGVLVVTPYRAQVRLLRKLAKEAPQRKKISIGTIHRHQGAERDVVVVDLVRAALSWSEAEICTLLNVAMSRAKRHFVLIVSRAELATPVLSELVRHLTPESVELSVLDELGGQQLLRLKAAEPITEELGRERDAKHIGRAMTLGAEIRAIEQRLPLFSYDQMSLFERKIGEGHYLIRGVAGSGKSLILANWAVRLVQQRPNYRILVTFYNRGLQNLLRGMLESACKKMWADKKLIDGAVDLVNISRVRSEAEYDAVFVDEAQDMSPQELARLYKMCRERTVIDGKKLRNLILFNDDSQNIYGRQTLDELRESLPEEFQFKGRSVVLRETYRSTQAVLSMAINMALDPKKLYSEQEPGLLQFMKVQELASEGLLIKPEQSPDGIYHVRYTERLGTPPIVVSAASSGKAVEAMAEEIQRLAEVS
jgi:hypothetical protein